MAILRAELRESPRLRGAVWNVLLCRPIERTFLESCSPIQTVDAMHVLDDKDRAILAELQRDSRQTVQQLAAAVGLTSTPCWKRVKEMEAAGVIRGYGASIDRERVGLALCVLAELNLTQHTENTVREFERAVAACPEIVSCYSTTGGADYSIKVLVEDIKRYESFLHDTAFKLPGVTHIRSSVVLKEVKAEAGVPIRASKPAAAPARKARVRA
jgi:DNA-binding Lrp family transcriptional regulator